MKEEEILDFVPSGAKNERPKWHWFIKVVHIAVMAIFPLILMFGLLNMVLSGEPPVFLLLLLPIIFSLICYFISRKTDVNTIWQRIILTGGIVIGIGFCLCVLLVSSYLFLGVPSFSTQRDLQRMIILIISLMIMFVVPVIAIIFALIELRFLWKKMPIHGTSDLN